MKSKLTKIVVLAVAALMLLATAGTTSAQADAAYVKTFDLKLPTADGAYKGVDPKGAKITWWHPHTGVRADVVKAAVDKFNKENPWGITVTQTYKGAYNDIFQAMLAAVQTGDVPQLTVAYQNEAAQYQNAKVLINLDDFVNDPTLGFGKDFKDDLIAGFTAGDVNPQFNQRLGFPLYRSIEVLYYNADALKKMGFSAPPKTWKEFEDMTCKYVKDGLGKDGYVVRTDASFVAAAAFGQGGDIYDYKANKFIYTSPEAKVMPTVIQDMRDKGCAQISSGANADQKSFETQDSLFYTGSSSGLPFINSDLQKSGKVFNVDIAALPFKDKPVMNVYGASVSIPKTTPAQQLAAWLFIRWYDEPDQQAQWATATNYFPVRKSTAANLKDYFAKNKAYESAFKLLLQDTKAEPPLAGYAAARDLAAKAMNNIIDGAPIDDELKKLEDAANKALADNQPGKALPTPAPTKIPTAAATTAATAAATAAK